MDDKKLAALLYNYPKLDQAVFVKIKNTLLGGEMMGDCNKFAKDFGWADSKFWSDAGEKNPAQDNYDLTERQKGMIIYERLYIEPSPKRFIELCQIAYDTLAYADSLEVEGKTYFWGAAQTFLGFLVRAFVQHGTKAFLVVEEIKPGYQVESNFLKRSNGQYVVAISAPKMKIAFHGQDFCENESREILINGYYSKMLDSIIQFNEKQKNKKWWKFWKNKNIEHEVTISANPSYKMIFKDKQK